jgi:peptidoglycan/LPS O-acetylase OafA/YrhL
MYRMGQWRLGTRPALDGLRGVAILLVLACHAIVFIPGGGSRNGPLGSAGVQLFFPLSGFLITLLLLEGQSLRRFYWNRALRLFPPLAALVVIVAGLQSASGVELAPRLWSVLLYVGNWGPAGGLGLLNPTWSLSIEEQFYLLWPLVLFASMRWRRGPLLVVTVGSMVSMGARIAVGASDPVRAYYGSDTQASSLLIGCLLALLAHRGLSPVRAPGWLVGCGALSLFGWAFVGGDWTTTVLVPTVVPIIGTMLIWAACSVESGPLVWRWLRYLGSRSYALYLWHWPLLWIVSGAGPPVATAVIGVALSLLVAELSWRLVEQPCRRFRSHRLDSGAVPPAEYVDILARTAVPPAQQRR